MWWKRDHTNKWHVEQRGTLMKLHVRLFDTVRHQMLLCISRVTISHTRSEHIGFFFVCFVYTYASLALVRMGAMNQLWCLILVLPLRLTHYILSNEFHQTEATDTSKAATVQAEKVSSMENSSKDQNKNENKNDPYFLRFILTGWLVYIIKSFQIIYISFIQNGH